MLCYVYSIKLLPTASNPFKLQIARAEANTWVRAETMLDARKRIFEFYHGGHWKIEEISVEHEMEFSQHLWDRFDSDPDTALAPDLLRVWNDLEQHGIGAEIFATPLNLKAKPRG